MTDTDQYELFCVLELQKKQKDQNQQIASMCVCLLDHNE